MLYLKNVGTSKNFGSRGGFRGEGGGRVDASFFFRDSNPCRPEGSPFETILRYSFLADGPQNFPKGAFGANIY